MPAAIVSNSFVQRLIRLAIDEDLSFGDVTSDCIVPKGMRARAELVAKENLVVCGLDLITALIEYLQGLAEVKYLLSEGDEAAPGSVLAEIKADARTLLALERVLLNFLQRMCGVATLSRKFVKEATSNTSLAITIMDTRKTTPGWRILEKYAARIGGAKNHRMHLGEMILVKNNHVDLLAGISAAERMTTALKSAVENKPPYLPLEVEVRSIEELQAALNFKPDFIMLDNMQDADLATCLTIVEQHSPRTVVEVSGGVTLERLKDLAKIGVQRVSLGAISTQARSVDIAMRMSRLD